MLDPSQAPLPFMSRYQLPPVDTPSLLKPVPFCFTT